MSYQPPQGGGPGWGPQGYPQQPGYPPPGYGAPPPPPKSKTSLVLVLGIAGTCIVCIAAGAAGKNGSPSSSTTPSSSSGPAPARQYVSETCAEVAHRFGARSRLSELQQTELWRQYDDKWVRWQVTAGEVGETFGQLQVQFRCGSESLIFDGHAYFAAEQRSQLLQVQQGSTITIEGRLDDHGRMLGLSIRDATIVQ